jgi:hypothetical protein
MDAAKEVISMLKKDRAEIESKAYAKAEEEIGSKTVNNSSLQRTQGGSESTETSILKREIQGFKQTGSVRDLAKIVKW